MGLPYHTHTFEVPEASAEEVAARLQVQKFITPDKLPEIVESDPADFATAAQGAKADTALQPANIGVSVQAYDADLAAIAALTTAAYGRGILETTSEGVFKALVNLEVGTDMAGLGANTFTGSQTVDGGIFTTGRYGNGGAMVMRRAEGSVGSPTVLSGAATVGIFLARGYDGSAYRDVAGITFDATAAPSGSSSPGSITLSVTPSGSTSSTEALKVQPTRSVTLNNGAVSTSATDGFLYIAGCAGTPTGAPTAVTGRVPLVVDTTNHKLYFYSGGSWRDAGP